MILLGKGDVDVGAEAEGARREQASWTMTECGGVTFPIWKCQHSKREVSDAEMGKRQLSE